MAGGESAIERLLHIGRQLARFLDLLFQRDLLHQVLKLEDGLLRDRILAGRDFQRVRVGGEVQIVGLDAAGRRVGAGIGVDRNEQIGLVLVGDGGPGFQRDEGVIVAGEDDVGSQASLQQAAQPQRDVQHQVLLHQAVGADGPSVVPAMPGVHHDAADLQTQGAGEAAFPGGGGLCFMSCRHVGGASCPPSCRPWSGEPPPPQWARWWAGWWPSPPDLCRRPKARAGNHLDWWRGRSWLRLGLPFDLTADEGPGFTLGVVVVPGSSGVATSSFSSTTTLRGDVLDADCREGVGFAG